MKRLSIAAVGLMVIAAWGQAAAQEQTQRAKPRVRVTISKETTYITEPLREDGYVDYLAALNQRCQKGVTPENNAAVLLLKAMGPGQIKAEHRDAYFRLLGIDALPEEGDYWVPAAKYIERLDPDEKRAAEVDAQGRYVLWDHLQELETRPWSKKEFPALADWLAANEKSLSLILDATRRPRRYDPLVAPDGFILDCDFLNVTIYREAQRLLRVHAMFCLGEGKVDEAWEDLLACHRLARLAGQGPFVIDALVADMIDKWAYVADQSLLQHVRLNAAQIAKMRDDLSKLPPIPRMADVIDVGERLFGLDCASTASRRGLSMISRLDGDLHSERTWMESVMDTLFTSIIDWDLIFRMTNACYDRVTDALRKPTRAQRMDAIDQITNDLGKLEKSTHNRVLIAIGLVFHPRATMSELCGHKIVVTLSPAIGVVNAEDGALLQSDLNQLAFALAAYRADQGSYPAKLAELTPKYVAKVPEDAFSAAELHYKREGDGYLLYSVGPNGKDDGARGLEDCTENRESWDDVVVRMTAGKKRE